MGETTRRLKGRVSAIYSEKIPRTVVLFDKITIARTIYLAAFMTFTSGGMLFFDQNTILNPDLIAENFVFLFLWNIAGTWGFFKTYQFAKEGSPYAVTGLIIIIFFTIYGILWIPGREISFS